jgi:hypothetical protein
MSKIPPIRRISTEDFKEQAGWIENLLGPINSYFEQTTTALNRGLTINDNFAGEIRDVTIDGTYPLKLAWLLSARPRAVLVGAIARTTGASFTQGSALQVQWSFNQSGQLQIDGVVGSLTPAPSAAAKYRITLVCLTG